MFNLTRYSRVRVATLSTGDVVTHQLGPLAPSVLEVVGVGNVGGPAFTPDGKQLLAVVPRSSAESAGIAVVDVFADRTIASVPWQLPRSYIGAAQFSPSTELLSLCSEEMVTARNGVGYVNGAVHVWRLKNQSQLLVHRFREGAYRTSAFSDDESLLAVGGGEMLDANVSGQIDVFELATGTHLATLTGHASPVRCVQFMPSSNHLVSGDMSGEVMLWRNPTDATSLPVSRKLAPGPWVVNHLAMSPGSSLLFVALSDWNRGQNGGEIRILDPTSMEQQGVLGEGHPQPIVCVQVAHDGRTIVALDLDSSLLVWRIEQR